MIERKLTIAEIMLIGATRVALGAGIGLLLSNRLNEDQRKAAGLALAVVGGLTTIPLALTVKSRKGVERANLRSAA
jgi:ABC-type anion transport system duplicated permease subunit